MTTTSECAAGRRRRRWPRLLFLVMTMTLLSYYVYVGIASQSNPFYIHLDPTTLNSKEAKATTSSSLLLLRSFDETTTTTATPPYVAAAPPNTSASALQTTTANIAIVLRKLIQVLKAEPDKLGLLDVTVVDDEDDNGALDNEKKVIVPGFWNEDGGDDDGRSAAGGHEDDYERSIFALKSQLLQEAFYDKKILFIGDSTLRFVTKSLHVLLHDDDDEDNSNSSSCYDKYKKDKDQYFTTDHVLRWVRLSASTSSTTNADNNNNNNNNIDTHNTTTTSSRAKLSLLGKSDVELRYKALHCMDPPVEITSLTPPNTTMYPHRRSSGGGRQTTQIGWGGNNWEEKIKIMDPDIIIVNSGMHYLHLFAGGDYARNHRATRGNLILMWMYYERLWLQHVLDVVRDHVVVEGRNSSSDQHPNPKPTLLLFKPTNRICDEEKFVGVYAEISQLYRDAVDNNDGNQQGIHSDIIRQCQTLVHNTLSGSRMKSNSTTTSQARNNRLDFDIGGGGDNVFVDDAMMLDYCYNGTLTKRGSQHLNQRFYKWFIQQTSSMKNLDHAGAAYGGAARKELPSNLRIGIFDDTGIESCHYTSIRDGRHFKELILVRLRLLANIINFASTTTGGGAVMTQEQFHQQMNEYAKRKIELVRMF